MEKRNHKRQGLPVGRNAIKTADPILRELFTIAHRRGVTMQELAIRVDRTTATISNWKGGNNTPTMLDVVILAQALRCEIVVVEKNEAAE